MIYKKKRYCLNDEGHMSCEKRRVQQKIAKKNEPKHQAKKIVSPRLLIDVDKKIKALNGDDVKYVMCKTLFNTNLNKNNNCLSMSIK